MRSIEHGVFTALRKVGSKEEFRELCEGLKDNDEAERLSPDILALPEILVSTDRIESMEPVDGFYYIFDGEEWIYTLVSVVMTSGREYLALSFTQDLSDLLKRN